jgi:hypothetical protein
MRHVTFAWGVLPVGAVLWLIMGPLRSAGGS